MSLFEAGPLENKRITAEACVHHLFFSAEDYAQRGAFIKCNPAIKTAADRQALLQAVAEDRIDVIATDHAPHTLEEKSRKYAGAPAGLPLVQHALVSLMERFADGTFTLEQIVRKTAHAPATLYQVAERGFLREGYFADITLIKENTTTADDPVLSKCGWSPFSGYPFKYRIAGTWVNGHQRYDGQQVLEGPYGQALTYQR